MAITWGSEFGNSSSYYGKLGVEFVFSETDTTYKVTATAYYASKYSVSDTSNTFYYDWDSYADTSMGAKNISHGSNSSWSSSNITKLGSWSKTFNKASSKQTVYFSLRCTGLEYGGGSGASNFAITIPALASYTLTFNPNGGTLPNPGENLYNTTNKANSVTVMYSTSSYWAMSSDIPTKEGNTFKGWYTAASGGTQVYTADGKAANEGTYWKDNKWVYKGNLTVYAQWTADTYTVSYNANGGSGAPSSQIKTHGKDLALSSTKPTRTGYTFVNWNTKSDGTGTSYSPGASYTKNATITLYAQWKLITYAVTYNDNGGSGGPGSQIKTYEKTLVLSTTIPILKGYKFIEWNTKSDGTGTSYSPGASYTKNAALTLYAVWKKTENMAINLNGTWKKGKASIDGKRGVPWMKVNGVWKKGGA